MIPSCHAFHAIQRSSSIVRSREWLRVGPALPSLRESGHDVIPALALTCGTVSKYSSKGLAEMMIISFSPALASWHGIAITERRDGEMFNFEHGLFDK